MKKVFKKAGLNVAKGILSETFEKAVVLQKKWDIPSLQKPDSGVGAANTYKIDDEKGLKDFFLTKPAVIILSKSLFRVIFFRSTDWQINQ